VVFVLSLASKEEAENGREFLKDAQGRRRQVGFSA
jgi:hypothetical protein